MTAGGPLVLHATCVADGERGLLILGRAGAGKSSLALRMIGLGLRLVSDDLTRLAPEGGALTARCPNPAAAGLIEARGVGILRVPAADMARVVLAVDLDRAEPERLPPRRSLSFCGCEVPVVFGPATPHLPVALLHLIRSGRQD